MNTTATTAIPAPPGPFKSFWQDFRRNRGALIGLYYIAAMLLIAVFAGLVAPHDPSMQYRDALLQPRAMDQARQDVAAHVVGAQHEDRKSTRLNSSHVKISYAVFCLKKKIYISVTFIIK